MNIGYSSRLGYDNNYYPERVIESCSPMKYRTNTNQIRNDNRCLSVLGPRSSYMGTGVSTLGNLGPAEAQELADLESIFTNRNVKLSKSKLGHVNPVNPLNSKMVNASMCGNVINSEYTHLSYPPANYRDMSINRFYDLLHDPQENLFWDFSVNTKLEAKDNYMPNVPSFWPDLAGPKPKQNPQKLCGKYNDSECGV